MTRRVPRLADQEGADNVGDERKVVGDVADEGDRVDQEPGDDEEDRDEQGLAEEFELGAGGRIAC